MNRFFYSLILLLGLGATDASERSYLTEDELKKILVHPQRPIVDRQRDLDRRPAKVLLFSEIAEGQSVIDIYAGGGWYTELLSKAVGSKGIVYAHNDKLTWRFGHKEMIARTKKNRLSNVVRLDEVAIADIDISEKSLDLAFMAINYHDLYFTSRVRNGKFEEMREGIVDYNRAFSVIKRALKPNGVLIVIDHIARSGSGHQAANDLHRIDPDIVKFQLESTGFELAEEAFYLRNSADDHRSLVFNEEIRGKTDRFIYKFVNK